MLRTSVRPGRQRVDHDPPIILGDVVNCWKLDVPISAAEKETSFHRFASDDGGVKTWIVYEHADRILQLFDEQHTASVIPGVCPHGSKGCDDC
jgi:hypothetical protein